MKTLLGAILLSIVTLSSVNAFGQPRDRFSRLLQSIDQNWYELSPKERSRALKNYQRFQKLPPEKRRNIEEQYNRWLHLPSEERQRIQQNYQRYRGMDSDQKEDFQRKYEHWRERKHR
jgi:hypothetical protein